MFVVDILENTGFLNTVHADMKAVLTRAGVSSHCAGSFLTNIAVLSIVIFFLVSATLFVLAILAAFDVYVDAFTRSSLTIRRTVAAFFIFASAVFTM